MPQFQPGHPGGPGRPKGASNKFKIQRIVDALADANIQPGKEIFNLYYQLTDPRDKLSFWLKLLPWIEPKIQKIEHIGERNSGQATGLEGKSDAVLLEILRPGNANGPHGPSA